MSPSSQPVTGSSFEERLQARLEAYEAAPETPVRRPADPEVVDLDQAVGQPELDELNRQVKVLRNQLKGALEEVDRRLEVAATRIEQAERRALAAHNRAEEVVDTLSQLELALRSGGPSVDPSEHRQRLRDALDQLKARASTPR